MQHHLAFDEFSNWSFSQLRGGSLCDVERWGNHLASGSVHTDKMNKTWELLQVSKNWVKVNNTEDNSVLYFFFFCLHMHCTFWNP